MTASPWMGMIRLIRPRRSGPLSVAALCVLLAARAAAQPSPASLLPASGQVEGWALTEPSKTFSGARLFDYMDGAGEIPRSYGFRRLASGKYRRGAVSLEAVVYDMGSAADAFGYYSARCFLEQNPSAKERIILLDHPAHLYGAAGVLTFWKDRYTIILQPETGKTPEATLLRFARLISGRIKLLGAPAQLLSRLPKAHRVANSERYVKGKSAFDSLLLFTPGDVFGAAGRAEAAAAEYTLSGATPTLFVVRYRTGQASLALNAFHRFLVSRKAAFSPIFSGGFAAMARKEKGVAAAVSGDNLAVVVSAADAKAAEMALKMLISASKR